ncbi:MAG: lysylphosphatidylglycerol synthase transmembrane domain-containing protein [Candidatus Saccharimonadales bacterium]
MSQASTTKKPTLIIRIQPKQLVIVLALVLLLYVIIPQLGSFRHSLSLVEQAERGWIIFGAVCYMGTSIMSVCIYRLLAPRHLPLVRTTIVQYGSSFANRLLPAGIGALGVSYFYLRKQKCTPASALAVVTLNNVLGTAGHFVLLLAILIVAPATYKNLHLGVHIGSQIGIVATVVTVIIALGIVGYLKFRRRLQTVIGDTAAKLGAYRHQKLKVGLALLFSMTLTMLHATCLWASVTALHGSITLAAAIVILGIGVSVGAAIPSPGGLGGAEAGLVAGLVAFGLAVPTAVAAAIVYRLATYWLGFVVGAFAFVWSEKKSYF